MPIPPDEAAALAKLKAEMAGLHESFYSRCHGFGQLDAIQLSHTGHKTLESALVYTLRDTEKALAGLTKSFLKQFPD